MTGAAVHRRCRSSLLFWLCLSLLALESRRVYAATRVALVETTGSEAWPVAEKRISAELVSLGATLVQIQAATEKDASLPKYAARLKAEAVLQVLRNGEEGVIRAWLADPRGGSGVFRHIVVDLRGPEVLSLAALAAVELIVNREQRLERKPPSVPRATEGDSRMALSAAAGVLFAGGGVPVAWALALGLHRTLAPHLSLVAEPLWAPSQPLAEADDFKLEAYGIRGFVGYAPWLAVPLRLTLSVGAGYIAVPRRLAISNRDYQSALFCVRNEFSVPLPAKPGLSATLRLTWSHATSPLTLRNGESSREAFDGTLDALIGLQAELP